MKREFHVRFCERLRGRFLWPTRPFPPVSLVLSDKLLIKRIIVSLSPRTIGNGRVC